MRTFKGYVVGAYAASPAHQHWDADAETEFYEALTTDPRIAALELPWLGRLHPHDDQWLIDHLPAHFGAVITGIPSTMSLLGSDPWFGLASPDHAGRFRALEHAARLRDDVHRLNDATAKKTVGVVELHCAPREHASAEHFSESLRELASWDWDGADLVVEHCDAWVPGQEPQKGFLSIDDEIAALNTADVNVGLSLNWGRSAIELRDGDRVVEHVTQAKESGRLRGIIFSGASARDGLLGPAWIDAHHPFELRTEHPHGIAGSLLTESRVREALQAAGHVSWLGVKVGWPRKGEGTTKERVQMISAALDALDRARS